MTKVTKMKTLTSKERGLIGLASELGELKNGMHVAGYSFERACRKIEAFLDGDKWKELGFESFNEFLDSINLEGLRASAEARKRIAVRIKEMQPKASNRRIAKALGTSEITVRRDTATNVAKGAKKAPKETTKNATYVAPAVSGAKAAMIVERRTTNTATVQQRRAERERELGAKISKLPDAKFGLIVADPAWHDKVYSEETGMNRHASRHYTTSTNKEIENLPVGDIAADDCVLFLWTTNQHLDVAIDVLRAWGFTYRSNYVWRKPSPGTGFWNRSVHEILLIGTVGNVPCPALGTQWESVIDADRGEHSAKPEIFLEMVEQYFPTVPKIELNRRGPARPNWSAWGNEAEIGIEHQEAAE
jgi:N6-adenosine-specific RNA methylase IME4